MRLTALAKVLGRHGENGRQGGSLSPAGPYPYALNPASIRECRISRRAGKVDLLFEAPARLVYFKVQFRGLAGELENDRSDFGPKESA